MRVESVLSFHPTMGFRDQSQVTMLGGKHLYPPKPSYQAQNLRIFKKRQPSLGMTAHVYNSSTEVEAGGLPAV